MSIRPDGEGSPRTVLWLLIACLVAWLAPLLLQPPVPLPPGAALLDHVDLTGHYWHYWHFARAVELGQPILSSTDIYFPVGGDHVLHRGGHLLVVLSWPIVALTKDPALATNLLSLGSLAITCFAGAVLARRFSPRLPVLLLGAVGLGTHRALFHQLRQGQTEEVLVGLIVFALLATGTALGGGRRLWVLLAGALLALCLYANLEFGVFLAMLAACAAAAMPGALRAVTLRRAVAVAGVAGLLASPALVVFWLHSHQALGGSVGYSGGEAGRDLYYLIQATQSVSLGSLIGRGEVEVGLQPSLVLLGFAAVGLFLSPRRERVFWAVVAVMFATLSLGPELRVGELDESVGGGLRLPLYYLCQVVPFLSRLHFPLRFLIVAHLGLVALAALGAEALIARAKPDLRRWVVAAVAVAALVVAGEHLTGWQALDTVPAPGAPSESTALLSAGEGDFAIIEVPSFDTTSIETHSHYLQRCLHRRPTLDGMGAGFLIPAPIRELTGTHHLLSTIRLAQGVVADPVWTPKPASRDDLELLGAMGFRYLVVRHELLEPMASSDISLLLERWLPPPVVTADAEVYTLPSPDGEPARIISVEHSRGVLQAYLEQGRP